MFGKQEQEVINVKGANVVGEVRNWYHDRYSIMIAQRNFLALVVLILAFGSIFGLYYIKEITTTRTIKPFVIQVEENTGITTVVDSLLNPQFVSRNESIKNYFIVKYLTARETYASTTYQYNWYKVVKLMSSQQVFDGFARIILNKATNPVELYGEGIFTTINIKSIQYNDDGTVATVRFRISENGARNKTYDKIATMKFELAVMTISREDSFINPVGFRVTSYRVDDEIYTNDQK